MEPGSTDPAPAGTRILAAGDLAEGTSAKFVLSCDGRDVDCFVVRFRGELHAFVNECRHVPMTMDWVENQFFTNEGDYLLCPTHGAMYVPDTGECVAGPACGKSLFRVPLVERDGEVFALRPERPA